MASNRDLERARAEFEAGNMKRAVRSLWKVSQMGTSLFNGPLLDQAADLAQQIGASSDGKVRSEAEMLAKYCRAASDDVARGERPTLLQRIFGRRERPQVKKCPDCAESILADAQVCRFCGYRYDRSQ